MRTSSVRVPRDLETNPRADPIHLISLTLAAWRLGGQNL